MSVSCAISPEQAARIRTRDATVLRAMLLAPRREWPLDCKSLCMASGFMASAAYCTVANYAGGILELLHRDPADPKLATHVRIHPERIGDVAAFVNAKA